MTAPDPAAPGDAGVSGLGPLRYGQALFNDLHRVAPDIADTIRATDADPFYVDERVPDFLRAVVDQARANGAAEERERRRRTAVALAAVAPDLDRAGYDRARRECADELRDPLRRLTSALIAVDSHLRDPYPDDPRWTPWTRFIEPALKALRAVPDRWSSSGRAPADEEKQR